MQKRELGFKSLRYKLFEASVTSAWHIQSLWELRRGKWKKPSREQDDNEKAIM